MKAHHARGAKETVFDMPAVVSSGCASRRATTCLRTAGVPNGAAAKNTSRLQKLKVLDEEINELKKRQVAPLRRSGIECRFERGDVV